LARSLYTLLLWLLLPVVLLRLVVKGFYSSAYHYRWAERFGYGPHYPDRFNVWIHAVSVGEVNAATPLISNLLNARPDCRILVTTMTPTGSERVRSTFDQQVTHCYAPYDYPFAVTHFLQRTSPDILILMETEIWPNIISQCHRMGTKVVMANVRMSEKSRRGYARILPVVGPALAKVSEFGVQSDGDRQRLIDLGISPNRVTRTGSMKFETHLPPSLREVAEAVRRDWGRDRSVIVCGSTHDGEESLLLGLLKDLSEREAELKGITALGLVSFPAGPGKIKIGAGVFGSSIGFMFEATYGMAIGSMDMRIGIRTAEVLGVIDSANRDLGHVGWMDGLVVLGVNI